MQAKIEAEKLVQVRLMNIKKEEENLRTLRDQKEKEALKMAEEEQKDALIWTAEQQEMLVNQIDIVKDQGKELNDNMTQRQNLNVKKLLKEMEDDI